jgi:hypothetical protein
LKDTSKRDEARTRQNRSSIENKTLTDLVKLNSAVKRFTIDGDITQMISASCCLENDLLEW